MRSLTHKLHAVEDHSAYLHLRGWSAPGVDTWGGGWAGGRVRLFGDGGRLGHPFGGMRGERRGASIGGSGSGSGDFDIEIDIMLKNLESLFNSVVYVRWGGLW